MLPCSVAPLAQGQEKQKLMEKWDLPLLSFSFVPWPWPIGENFTSWLWFRAEEQLQAMAGAKVIEGS